MEKNIFRLLQKLPGVTFIEIVRIAERPVVLYPKVGSRTLRNALMTANNYNTLKQARQNTNFYRPQAVNQDTFGVKPLIFIRDPLERLHSTWKQKITVERDMGYFYFWNYYPILRPNMSFEDFLSALTRIPLWYTDKHVMSVEQYLGGKEKLRFFEILNIDQISHFVEKKINVYEQPANTTSKQIQISSTAYNFFQDNLADRYEVERKLMEN
jgi:hypothetical protein